MLGVSPAVALTVTAPESGGSSPAMIRSSVDLPEPFSPMMPTRSSAETTKETSVSTRRSAK